jgi:hypothetical protein
MLNRIKIFSSILLLFAFTALHGQQGGKRVCFEFYDGVFNINFDQSIIAAVPAVLTDASVKQFYQTLSKGDFSPVVNALVNYKEKHRLNDWLYYQLIRNTAQQISPKADNYSSYTLYKWFLMVQSGYDARLALADNRIIFYILNDEDISDIPFFMIDDKKYMTLNYHDYDKFDLHQNPPVPVKIDVPGAMKAFSYKITRMPDFKSESYIIKDLYFNYRGKEYNFEVKLNPSVQTLFANYPVVDFESYFNIPLSKETYSSLIPLLQKNVSKLDQKKGVDYLMHFTRYAFLYEDDVQNFGKEKRLSPEETLFAEHSDCDDRAALFFYLVKEIYNLPMITLLYPTHINIAVQFNKPIGTPIVYKGKTYSACEPTPQRQDLNLGQISVRLKNIPYQVVYEYDPTKN